MVAYTIFQAYVAHVTLEIALNIQANVYNKPCLYLFEWWHRFMFEGCSNMNASCFIIFVTNMLQQKWYTFL